jgi:uncharacterized protein (DUF2062 family)
MKFRKKLEEAKKKLIGYLKQGVSPAEISFAIAIGIFVAFIPMVGVHTALAFVLAWVLRINPVIVFLGTQVSNPLTFPLQVVISAQAGHLLLHGGFLHLEWSADIDWINTLLWPTLLGSLILGIVFSVAIYIGVYQFLKRRRG